MAEPAALGNKMRRNEYACPPASKPRFPSVIAALIVASSLTLNCGPNRPPSISPVPTTPQATLAQPEAVRNSIATFISDLIARENSAFYFDPKTVAALTEFARELRIDQIASLTKTPTLEEIDALGVKVPVFRLKEMNIERVKLELLLDALRLNCEYEGNGELTLKDSLSNREGKGKRTFNCVGYAFLMYIYGEAIGIRNIKPVFVFLAENENHVALMVTLAKTHLVDATVSDGLGQSSYISASCARRLSSPPAILPGRI
ncbi:MAG: hypothetical protein NT049_00570 [Planctomycetota bacterium]|nr:hypothetical protein [Planctomycetota bacterium]